MEEGPILSFLVNCVPSPQGTSRAVLHPTLDVSVFPVQSWVALSAGRPVFSVQLCTWRLAAGGLLSTIVEGCVSRLPVVTRSDTRVGAEGNAALGFGGARQQHTNNLEALWSGLPTQTCFYLSPSCPNRAPLTTQGHWEGFISPPSNWHQETCPRGSAQSPVPAPTLQRS